MCGKSASLTGGEGATDYSSEEGGLPEGFRIEDIGENHENYTIADMYNALRAAGFSGQQSHGFIEINLKLIDISYNKHKHETFLDGGFMLVSPLEISATSRLGVDFGSCSDATVTDVESKTENYLTKLLDCFGLATIKLNLDRINYGYANTLPIEILNASASMER